MTKPLFMQDSYLKEVDSNIISVKDGKYIVLDQTIFYPNGGGQPWDTGKIIKNEETYNVIYVGKFSGEISHEVDKNGLKVGDKVRCFINWQRRYKLMRSHTAAHLFASLLYKEIGVLITGNQLQEDKIRFDFNFENYDREILKKYVVKANEILKQDMEVKWFEMPKEEALKIPDGIKMAKALPPNIPNLRVVEITGIDRQIDGGTHVKNLKEVGQLELIKTVNKGKNNRRVYLKLIS